MIRYNPLDGDVWSRRIRYLPRTCFIMTRLGTPLPQDIQEMRDVFSRYAKKYEIEVIDAESRVTGKDFLLKIWDMMAAVPLGVAIVSENLPVPTLCNIYYELGVLQAQGKETLVIKTKACPVPSDFVRTEYIEFHPNRRVFGKKLERFFCTYFEQAEHYAEMAELVVQNPALAIDYLRRAYLISGDERHRAKAKELFREHEFDAQRQETIRNFLTENKGGAS